jgi:hypothetical protein
MASLDPLAQGIGEALQPRNLSISKLLWIAGIPAKFLGTGQSGDGTLDRGSAVSSNRERRKELFLVIAGIAILGAAIGAWSLLQDLAREKAARSAGS